MRAVYEQWLILISTPFYMAIIALEVLLSNYHDRKLYSWKDTATNLYLMLLNSAIDLLFRGFYIALLAYCYQHRYMEWHQAMMYWVLLLLAEDFLYYWLHRFDHEIRLFWAVHVTHHSSEQMNFTVGFRSSVFQPLYRFIYFVPLAILGFKPLDIVLDEWKHILQDMKRSDIGWKEKIFYLFGPPGWSHDGSRVTSEQLRILESTNNDPTAAEPHTPCKEAFSPVTSTIK